MKHFSQFKPAFAKFAGVLSGFWLSLFRRAEIAPPSVVVEQKPKKPRVAADPQENYTFHFKGALLDQLDPYFDVLKTMRAADPEAFSLYSQIGAHLLPDYRLLAEQADLSPWWRVNRPGFGAVACGVDSSTKSYEEKAHRLTPRFIYFTKYESRFAPSEVQRVTFGLDVYVVTVYWEDKRRGKKRLAAPTQFPIAVDAQGGVRVLRSKIQERKSIVGKHGRNKGTTFTIPQTKWGIEGFFREWATENKRPVEEFLRGIFVQTANQYELANQAMAKVLVSKGGLTATFGIEPRRCAYFFKDRDVNLGDTGSRKKVFHIVRPHTRRTKIGQTFVKMHFRGERAFVWNGYAINVTVPGLHHALVQEFNVGSIDEEHFEKLNEKTTDIAGMAKTIRSHIINADWKKRHQKKGAA